MNKFTRKMMLAIACVIAGCINIQAQYQLPNPGFEGTWKETTWGSILGKSKENAPQYWHSFGTAAGSLQSMTKASVSQSTETRTSTGYCAKISATNPISSIVGNGTLTTGRMNAGSMTPDDETGNYNFTDLSNEEYQQKFTGRPDAISFWVKSKMASSTEEARAAAILHDNFQYQDPTKNETILSHKIGSAELNYTTTNEQWVQKTINFEYNQNATPSFLLLTFTTNKTPGGGSKTDVVYIDDIEFIYNSKLESLNIDGSGLDDFAKETYNYTVLRNGATPTSDQITAVSDGKGASINKNINGNVATITVSGNDISVNSENKHIYTLTFWDIRSQLSSISIGGVALNGFAKDTYNYTIFGDGIAPALDQITAEAESTDAKVNKSVNGNIITVTVSGYDIETNPTNKHVYTITYQDVRSQLSSLSIGGVALDGFDKDNYTYTILGNGTVPALDQIVAVADGNGATVDKSVNGNVVTITVSGSNIATDPANKHVYTITYQDIRSQLSSLSIGGVALDGFDKDTYSYTVSGDGTVPALDQITAEADGNGATVDKSVNGNVVTITVSGSNIATDPANKHVYTITYQDVRSQLSSISIGGVALDGFDKDTYSYTVSGDGTVPALDQITAEADGNGATVDKSVSGNVVTITVSGSNIATDPANKHVYTITFDYEQSIGNSGTTEGIKVYSANGNVFVQGYTGTVEVYLLNGGKIAQKEVSGNEIFRLEPNTYIILTGTKATTVIVK